MKHAVKKYNKLIAFVLALALMVFMIPMGIALADGEVYPVVVDSSFTGTAGTLVDYDADGYSAADLATYKTLGEAFNALGAKGGKIWIKGTYYPAESADLQNTDSAVTEQGLVTIAGFGDAADGGFLHIGRGSGTPGVDTGFARNDNYISIATKGDVKIENIKLNTYDYSCNFRTGGFYSNGYKLILGEGISTQGSYGLRLGGYGSTGAGKGYDYDTNIDVYSGKIHVATPFLYQFGGGAPYKINTSANYNFYGGTVKELFATPTLNKTSKWKVVTNAETGEKTVELDSGKFPNEYYYNYEDVVYNIYEGATINGLFVGSYGKYALGGTAGNILINVEGGNVPRVTFGHSYIYSINGYSTNPTKPTVEEVEAAGGTKIATQYLPKWGNIAIIVNGAKEGKTVISGNTSTGNNMFVFDKIEGKKFITIINNVEGGNASLDLSNEALAEMLDYNIQVRNGKAEPVYEGKNSAAILKGFKITPDAEGYPIYINGEIATPDAEGVYTIEPKGSEVIDINVSIDYKAVLGAEGTEVNTDEKLFTNFAGAAAYLGAEGGTIYVKGAEVSVDNLAAASAHKEITVVGYNNDSSNKIKITGASTIKGNITFKNVTVSGTNNWATGTNTITFGEGARGTVSSRGAANLVFDSEYIKTTEMTAITGSLSGEYSVTLNKGEFAGTPSIMIGSYANYPSSSYLNGNYTLTVNGGKIGVLYFAYQGNNSPGYQNVTTGVKGNTIIRLNGGVINNFSIGQQGSTSVLGKMHNIAIITDMQGENDYVNILTYNHLGGYIERYNENSKWIIIRNHAATNKASAGNASIYMDYAIDMFGGVIEPVFSEATGGDASTSVLLGFKITPDAENAGKNVLANEKFLTPNSYGLYDLSEFEASGLIRVGFEAEETKDYSQFMSLGNDLNNSYNKLIDPDATVNVVYVGGSVTIGDGVVYNDRFTCWRERVGMWLKNSFPANVNNINRAGSGSGTNFGLYRNYHDIISADPDLLFIEFSINDGYDGTSAETAKSQLETMIREIKLAKPECDIVIILTTDKGKIVDAMNGKLHAQAEAHEAVAKAYGIPVVYVGKSLGAELDPAVKTDAELLEKEWSKYISDYCHPNAAGYDVYFRTIRAFLNTVYSGSYVAENKVVDVTDDSTIISNKLADGNKTLITGDMTTTAESAGKAHTVDTTKTLANVSTTGFVFKNEAHTVWELRYNGYLNLVKGTAGTLTYTFSGTEFILFGNFIEKDAIYFTVDGGEEQTYTFGANNRYPTKLVKDAEPGEHTITVRFDWATLSNADELHVFAVGYRDDSVATGREKKEVITDLSVIAGYINGEIPVKEGYLFGGFIGEDGKALKADEIANAESLTVKFIPKAVLDIGWQIRQEGNTVDLRLISTVDSLEYSAVTFIVKVADRDDMVLTSKKVYTKIAGYKDGENVQYAPTAFSAASEYFMTHVIKGIPVGFHDVDFTVTANLLTKDGKTITGDAKKFQIKNHADYTAIVE